MGRTTTLLDDALTRKVGKLPGWAAFVFASLVYVGFGLVLPYATRTTTLGRIVWNLFGVAWGCVIILAWLFSNQQRLHRRFLLEWSSDLRRLSATEFEWLVGDVMRREGWDVEELDVLMLQMATSISGCLVAAAGSSCNASGGNRRSSASTKYESSPEPWRARGSGTAPGCS